MKKRRVYYRLDLRTTKKDEAFSGRSVEIGDNGEGPWESNAVNIVVGKDGHVAFFSDDVESHIYFYPNQVKHLRRALRAIPKTRRVGAGRGR